MGDLFHRFFFRFLIGLALAFLILVPLVHVFQKRFVFDEWREDLRQENHWLAVHAVPLEMIPRFSEAWRTMHDAVRVTFYDDEGNTLGDSHPERTAPDFDLLRAGGEPRGSLVAIEEMKGGNWVVMSRPWVQAFPHGLRWELLIAGLLIVGPMFLLIYPAARSMSKILAQLGELAQQVSSGQFGRTLEVDRSDEVGNLVRAFNDMSSKLAAAEGLNTRLLHDVSHELRSPLGRIQVLAESVTLRPEEARECVRGIEQEIQLLDRLIGDLLQVATLEAESASPLRETFSITHWAGETLPRLERGARSNGIAWSEHLPAQDREVRGDPQRLAQALGNLVDNAAHALAGQSDGRIEVELAAGVDHWTLSVTDNGPGIPAEDLDHVFRRFYRVGADRDRSQGGVGLGLALVRAIAEAHGGEASIASEPGAGTRVTLSLPLA